MLGQQHIQPPIKTGKLNTGKMYVNHIVSGQEHFIVGTYKIEEKKKSIEKLYIPLSLYLAPAAQQRHSVDNLAVWPSMGPLSVFSFLSHSKWKILPSLIAHF